MYPRLVAAAWCLTAFALPACADTISYTGGSYAQDFAYSQDFDSLPSTGGILINDPALVAPVLLPVTQVKPTGMRGWSFGRSVGEQTRFIVDDGGLATSGVFSYGAVDGLDRALGAQANNAGTFFFGAVLVNDSTETFTEFTLSFAGEQWRDGSGSPNKLAFSYSLDASNILKGAFTEVPELIFAAPKRGSVDTALNGNLAANRLALGATVSGINWAPGGRLVLRWRDANESGNDDGLAIDDLRFSAAGAIAGAPVEAVPLPSVAVAALPLLAGLALRRSRRGLPA